MRFHFRSLFSNKRELSSACVETPIYSQIVRTKLIKIITSIIIGTFFLLVIMLAYTSIPHRIRDPFAVELRHMNYEFNCVNIGSDEVRIQFFWLDANMGDLAARFGNTSVFGSDSIPKKLLMKETNIRRRLTNKSEMLKYNRVKDRTPMVYLNISNNQAENYLAVVQIRYGIFGSPYTVRYIPNNLLDYILYDKYGFDELEFPEKLVLFPVAITTQEDRAIIVSKNFKYYLITDDAWLANDPWLELPSNIVGSTKSYWLVENNSYESDS